MTNNSVLDNIYNRRSIRVFTDDQVDQSIVKEVIKAGTYAPSGLNNQPWRFIVIRDKDLMDKISKLTHYSKVVNSANVLIAVLLDNDVVYNRDKDLQAVGACIQNILLAIQSFSLGAVWLGEILNKKDEFHKLISLEQQYELMAVVAMGHKTEKKGASTRKGIDELILQEI
ncbi:nitroreductase family protein [Thermodesulfobacteriota bacterium]